VTIAALDQPDVSASAATLGSSNTGSNGRSVVERGWLIHR
jgi:hypothetical protein